MNVLAARGLYAGPSQLANAPDGAMVRADNVRIRRAGVAETRNGEEALPALSDTSRVDAMASWRGVVVAHRANGKLARFSGGAWTDYPGTYLPPTGGAVRFTESAGDLLFTTSEGVYRLDAVDGQPKPAGVPKALQMRAWPSGLSGYLPGASGVAYRAVWGTRTATDRLLLGAPSGRAVVYNTEPSGTTRNVTLIVPIPTGVTGDHFLQLHRSEIVGSGYSPPDEMALVYEAYPTADELAAGRMEVTDIAAVPTGANLYTNPSSGDGILAQRDPPPYAKVLGTYKGHAVYANTRQVQRITLALLSVEQGQGLSEGDGLVFDDGVSEAEQYIATTNDEDPDVGAFQLYTDGSVAQNLANTVASLVRVINARAGGMLTAYAANSVNDPPGAFTVEARSVTTGTLRVRAIQRGNVWSPALRAVHAASYLQRSGGVVSVEVDDTSALSVGQTVWLSRFEPPDANFPTGPKVISAIPVPGGSMFEYIEAGPDAMNDEAEIEFDNGTPEVHTSDNGYTHGLAFSSYNEPDAVPPSNYAVLPTNDATEILWVQSARASLFIGTTNGLYRLTGEDPSTIRIEPFDTSYVAVSGSLSVSLNNVVYADSQRGIVAITDSGVLPVPVTEHIEEAYNAVKATTGSAFAAHAFIIPYPTESELEVWLPSTSEDTHATQALVYNTLTGAWTRDVNTATAAVVGADDRRYFGQPNGRVWRERKTGTLADYYAADNASGIPVHVTYAGQDGGNPTVWKYWTELYFHLQSGTPTSSQYEIFTDYVPTPYAHTLLPTNGTRPGTVWHVPDQNHVRCKLMFLGFTHNVPGQRVELLGYGVTFRSYGGRTGPGN